MDADPEWFPGKSDQSTYGRSKVMSAGNANVVAQSAMNMKRKGAEPTYGRVVAGCPTATHNPETNRPFAKRKIYEVL